MNSDRAHATDVLDAMKDAAAFVGDLDFDAFAADRKTASAVLWKLEVIGEATKRLSTAVRDAHPQVPWRQMAGMRDKLIHGYDRIELPLVYEAVKLVIPPLIPMLEAIIETLPIPD